ncbi:hypothetical protein E4U09_004798 [Claviceps aff. purpurea]|uniref:Uncharacterized protein n=1 Tax=Claviceps aff. purpurea TaxID=1967640 RepID=A0A9P7U139_9HYPO|nr:hypothetical protein E4U09_004798 [Claviceps aff. purpurea]
MTRTTYVTQTANKSLLLPSQSPPPTSACDLFVPSWDVAVDPGQEDKIVVNGTIQQVDAYMEAHYPSWSAKWANFILHLQESEIIPSGACSRGLAWQEPSVNT